MVSLEEARAAEARERAALADVERRLQELRARDEALSKVPSPARSSARASAASPALCASLTPLARPGLTPQPSPTQPPPP